MAAPIYDWSDEANVKKLLACKTREEMKAAFPRMQINSLVNRRTMLRAQQVLEEELFEDEAEEPVVDDGAEKLRAEIEKLKATNRRLMVQLEEAKDKRADLVAAVRQAALDGISSLQIPTVSAPPRDKRRAKGETAIAWLS